MIKIEFPADRADIALAIGKALTEIGEAPAVKTSAAASAGTNKPAGAAATGATTATAEGNPLLAHAGHGETTRSTRTVGTSHTECPDTTSAESSDEDDDDSATGERPTVDPKGVAFNPEMCAKAAKPFYASGPRKGQWKKRQGVDEDAYDEWYADALLGARVESSEPEPEPEPQVDVTQVWGGGQQQQAVTHKAPSNPGEFFQWVAEMQNAGHLTQQDVDAAYAQHNINAGLMFTSPPDAQAAMIAALHGTLAAKVPA